MLKLPLELYPFDALLNFVEADFWTESDLLPNA